MIRHLTALLLGASALTACAAGPDYKAPAPPPLAAAPFMGAANPALSANPAQERWWALYHDPLLDQLVDDALAANTDIRQAVARIERARASLRGAKSDRLPQTNLDAVSYTHLTLPTTPYV